MPHLPSELTFEFIRENPLFNRRGDYTYDIDISLRDPHNRAIYQHIDRLTANRRPQNRRARLIADGHVIADGTEAILTVENEYVKIQILAGNSELNYLSANTGEQKIRKLQLGTYRRDRYAEKATFPDSNYTYPLIEITNGDNNSAGHFRNTEDYRFIPWNSDYDMEAREKVHPCPFLLHIVESIINALGYTLRTNELAHDPRWQRLVIIHGYSTTEYAKMLPNWTVTEFIEQIEAFFDCIIVCGNGYADILRTESFYSTQETVDISAGQIDDNIRKDYTKDTSELHLQRSSLQYQLGNGTFGAVNNFNEDVEEKCSVIDTTLRAQQDQTTTGWYIMHETDCDFDFVILPEQDGDDTHDRKYIIRQFCQHSDDATEPYKLKIIPADIQVKTGEFGQMEPRAPTPTVNKICNAAWLLPQVSLVEVDNDRTWQKFAEAIHGGEGQDGEAGMEVAFVAMLPVLVENGTSGLTRTAHQLARIACLRWSTAAERVLLPYITQPEKA